MVIVDVDVTESFLVSTIVSGLDVAGFCKCRLPDGHQRSREDNLLEVFASAETFRADLRHALRDVRRGDCAAVEAVGPNIFHFRREVYILEEFILRESRIPEFLNRIREGAGSQRMAI